MRLTWPQFVWSVGVLAAILGAWFDLRSQVRVQNSAILGLESRISRLEERNERLGFTRDDAEKLARELRSEMRQRR